MYNNMFVANIKSNGNFLREIGDRVLLPFNSEYSLYFKNLNSMRVAVAVDIDGEDVLDGSRLIINNNETLELEGFLQDDAIKNKFKFVRRIKEIEEHRGIRPEDGLIKIRLWFEKQYTNNFILTTTWQPLQSPTWVSPVITCNSASYTTENFRSCDYVDTSMSDPGITVKGSESNQRFTNTYFSYGEQSGTIILQLNGESQNQEKVISPIFTKTKFVCENCGLKNSSQYRFCPRCGTVLF